ncbi:MAG: hypothetical protein QM536_07260 [Chitinophagaceae bacterium]|nr:hypothetical protein [Chitinophagaceae bacterium]
MENCSFSINFYEETDALLGRAKTVIEKMGGSFTGSNQNGNFFIHTPIGAVRGTYIVNNNSILFQITDKPFLITCGKIEGEIRKYLNISPLGKNI